VHGAEFATIPQAGHFLDLEGRQQQEHVRQAILGFFGAAAHPPEEAQDGDSLSSLLGGALPAM
jgi:rhamnosyltransferase subunit A